MKSELLLKLQEAEQRLRSLRTSVTNAGLKSVNQQAPRKEAEALANLWVEELRSPLEHRFKIPADVIATYAERFKQLHVLARPNNLSSSYVKCIGTIVKNFKDDLILPIQQSSEPTTGKTQLRALVGKIPEDDVSDYLTEAIECAEQDHNRAGIVMGWCAAIDHIQKKLVMLGLNKFNTTSTQLKAQTHGRFKRFTKEFKVTTLSELQEVFDTDLLWVLEGMGLIDGNQGDRLRTCFQYRNHSAHPGEAPINDVHLNAFFNDIVEIVLTNPKLSLTPP